MKLGLSLVDDAYYIKPKFHFNKKAAYAFASRFYLIKGEWDRVVSYSDYVLGIDPKPVLRNWQKYKRNLTPIISISIFGMQVLMNQPIYC